MKERTISALIGLIVLAVAFVLYPTVLFNVLIGAVSLIAVFELLNAIEAVKYRGIVGVAISFSLFLPFVQHPKVRPFVPLIVFLLLIWFLILVIKNHNTITFVKAIASLAIGTFVPLFFCSAVYVRDKVGPEVGLYYLIFALGSAWLCDTGAYFSGYFFGKRKMAPTISPKKTVEGAIGGVIIATVINLGIAFLYSWLLAQYGITVTINYLFVVLFSPILALLGMLGDLMASVIKRQNDIKDYGHIMPGHGGVMDRFDSVLVILPAVYIITLYFPFAV